MSEKKRENYTKSELVYLHITEQLSILVEKFESKTITTTTIVRQSSFPKKRTQFLYKPMKLNLEILITCDIELL